MPASVDDDEDEMLKMAIAISLQEESPRIEEDSTEEEMLALAIAMSMQE